MKRIASLFTYPWDLHDEGIDRALDVMTGTAGMTSICLAVSYHISTYFLPHNPRRKIYYGEHGALYFQPDATKYRKTTIRPHVSEVVDGPHYLPAIIERTRAKGIEFAVWVVYCFNHYLARTFPSCAKVDPFGSPYHAQLCPANPDVRAYFLAMTDDIVANYHPDAFHIESLSYLPFRYGFLNPKVLSDITPLCEFLMGLCYCPHCLAAADRAGLDGERFRADVAGFLEKELARLPGKDEMTPLTDEHVNTLFDGRLSQFLQTRADVATSLFEEVVATVRSYGTTAIQTVVPTQEDLLSSGLRPDRVRPLLDRTLGGLPSERVAAAVQALRRTLPERTKILVNFHPAAMRDADELVSRARQYRDGGVDGYTAYNYGLLRMEHLRWLDQVRRVWSE